ncbi:LysM domain protein [Metarhizium robertsii]|uniref:LysM domain protein n=1 Tax=Metarhizium robertsii TaxID=568076 RepID=A0A014N448_9HYPO|nr:LysM domain protein [Metarhizium robertsii]
MAVALNERLDLDKCSELYTVKNKDEDCVVIGVQHGTSWAKLVKWNLALKDDCRNIYGTDPFWGRVICVSQPGGEYADPVRRPSKRRTRPASGVLVTIQRPRCDPYRDGPAWAAAPTKISDEGLVDDDSARGLYVAAGPSFTGDLHDSERDTLISGSLLACRMYGVVKRSMLQDPA